MAGILDGTMLSYADTLKRNDPDNTVADIVELLSKTNPMIADATVMEANGATHHRTTVRTGLPPTYWRKLNAGVQRAKSVTAQVDDPIGMLEVYAEVDKQIIDLSSNPAAMRLTEDMAFIEAMNQEMSDTVLYGDTTTAPDEFNGLAPRYNSVNASIPSSNQVQNYKPGSTGGDHTSIWFVTWGPNTTFLTYPKGSQIGLSNRDLGEHTLSDGNGGQFQGFRTHYKWDLGLVVRDWRYNARIANIDTVDLLVDTSTALIQLMIRAYNSIQTIGMGNLVIYCNRLVKTQLDIMIMEKSSPTLTVDNYGGQPTTHFLGIPIRMTDAITNLEQPVAV